MKDSDKTWQDIDELVERLSKHYGAEDIKRSIDDKPFLKTLLESKPVEKPFTKHDSGKPQLSLVPGSLLAAVARVMEYGAVKYGRDNWRNAQAEDAYRLADAALRHMVQWLDNFEPGATILAQYDDETNAPHLWHAACCLAFLIDLAYREGWEGYNPWDDSTTTEDMEE